MGDGRFYTYDQFFNTIFFTMAIILLVICFMINLLKGTRYKRYILTSGILLSVSLICRFINEVAYKESRIDFYGMISQLLLWLFIVVFLMFIYILLKENKQNNGPLVLSVIFFSIPIVLQVINYELELVIYSMFIGSYTVISSNLINYRVSASIFADVKKLLIDDVFITALQGEIIYKSNRAHSSNVFKKTKKINKKKFQDFFVDEIIIRNAFGKQIIKVKSELIKYFHHSEKDIYDNEKIAGYIHTFTEITPLISMLDELKKNQDETRRINDELLKYKEIVYELEREKEINSLLDEIANNQQKSMSKLKENIEKLSFADDLFIDKIDHLIETAKGDLSNVREHVTSYMHYYSEGS